MSKKLDDNAVVSRSEAGDITSIRDVSLYDGVDVYAGVSELDVMQSGVRLLVTDSDVDDYVKMMLSSVDIKLLMSGLSRCMGKSDRQSVYEDYLQMLGKKVFKSDDSYTDRRDKSKGVYYHNGRLWCAVDGITVRRSLKVLCTQYLRMTAAEWLKGERRYLDALYDGARMSQLRLRRSLVAFSNGIYDFSDLHNIVYHAYGDRDLDVVSALDYDYDVKAKCPLWERFLSQVLDGEQRLLLQKFMSLGLVDRSTMRHKVENCLWMVGPGGVGKSTIANVISYVYGEDSISGLSMGQLLSGGNEERSRFMAVLSGKVFNFCKEVQLSDMTYHVDTFKSLCSGESQQMRRIGGDVKELRDIPYFVFNMNSKPRSGVIDGALMRRLLFLSFRQMISDEDRDPELESKLKREAAGIRNWLIEGWFMLLRDNFKFVQTGRAIEESDEMLVQNGKTLQLFLQKMDCRCRPLSGHDDKPRWIPAKVLYGLYERWCMKNAYDTDVTSSTIGKELRFIGYDAKRTSAGVSYRFYGGEKLL